MVEFSCAHFVTFFETRTSGQGENKNFGSEGKTRTSGQRGKQELPDKQMVLSVADLAGGDGRRNIENIIGK